MPKYFWDVTVKLLTFNLYLELRLFALSSPLFIAVTETLWSSQYNSYISYLGPLKDNVLAARNIFCLRIKHICGKIGTTCLNLILFCIYFVKPFDRFHLSITQCFPQSLFFFVIECFAFIFFNLAYSFHRFVVLGFYCY